MVKRLVYAIYIMLLSGRVSIACRKHSTGSGGEGRDGCSCYSTVSMSTAISSRKLKSRTFRIELRVCAHKYFTDCYLFYRDVFKQGEYHKLERLRQSSLVLQPCCRAVANQLPSLARPPHPNPSRQPRRPALHPPMSSKKVPRNHHQSNPPTRHQRQRL